MNRLNKIIFIILITICSNVYAAKDSFKSSVDNLIKEYIPNAHAGISIKNCDDKTYYSKNSKKYFTPASNTKLFTCTVAELYLGKDFKFTTAFKLYRSLISNGDLNGNLYISFTGDPSYTTQNLKKDLTTLKKLGIKWIRGNIVIDDSVFLKPIYAPGISYDDVFYYYGVPPRSIILDRNILKLEIKGGRSGGDSADILNKEQNKFFNIKNNVVTVENSAGGDSADISANIDEDDNIILSGSISANYKVTEEIPIKNSFKYICNVIKYELRMLGISFDKRIITGKIPENLDAVVVNTSPALPELIKHTLKKSDNLYADALLKNMGMQRRGIGTYAEGLKVIGENVQNLAGIDPKNYKLFDGSGLSRYNLVTADQVSELLVNAYSNQDLNQYIFNSLPISGTDGTLKNRMGNIPLKGRVRAKTGTMTGVSALSGYICFDSGRPIVFSILLNGILDKDNNSPGRQFQDALCRLIYDHFKDVDSRK